MRTSLTRCPPRAALSLIISVTILGFACLVLPATARADRYYVVYAPAPPPPAYGYYYYGEPASALVLGGDIDGLIPISVPRPLDGHDLTSGGGFKLRLGEQIRLRRGLRITPEVGYGFSHLFASGDVDDSWDVHRVFGGVRLSFGHIVAPTLYGHVGYAWRVTDSPVVNDEGGAAFDVGGALDIRVIPHFDFGPHIEYTAIAEPHFAPQWVALGVHADIVF